MRTVCFIFCFLLLASPARAQNDAAYQQFLFAYRLLERQEYDLAGQAFDDYLGAYPSDSKAGDARYYRALIHRRMGEQDQAIAVLDGAPSPTLLDAWRPQLLLGQLFYDAGDFERSTQALGAIDVQALDAAAAATVTYHLGRGYRSAGNLPAAARFFAEAGSLDTPVRPRALYELAQVRVLNQEPDAAIEALREVIAAEDETLSPAAAKLAGDLARQANQQDDAATFYQAIVQQYPSSGAIQDALVGLMSVYAQAGQHNQVTAAYETHANTLAGTHRASAMYLAGTSYLAQGQHASARLALLQLVDHQGDYPPGDAVLYQLATAEFRLGQYAGADAALQAFRDRHPESAFAADAAYLQAVSYVQAGRRDAALLALTQIVEQGVRHPHYGPSLLMRADQLTQAQQPEQAIEDYLAYFELVTIPDQTPNAAQTAAMLRLLQLGHELRRFDLVRGLAWNWVQDMQLPPTVEQDLLYRLGLAAWSAQDFEMAGESLARLEEEHPEHAYAAPTRYYLGRLAILQGDEETGVTKVRQAVAMQGLPEPLIVEAFRIQQAYHMDRHEPALAAHALAQLEQVVTLDGLTDTDLLWLARFHLDQGNPDESLRHLQPVLDGRENTTDRLTARALYLAGLAERERGESGAAADRFQHVLALGAGWELESTVELAGCLAELERYRQALATYRTLYACGVLRVQARALYEAADAHLAVSETEEAREALLRLVLVHAYEELAPYPHLGYLKLAPLSDDPGATLRELAETFPDTPYAAYAQAVITTEPGEAIEQLNALEATWPEVEPLLQDKIDALRESLTATSREPTP